MQLTLLHLFFVASGLLLCGCATKQQSTYVIVGLDYGDAKSILSLYDSTNKHVRLVRRNPAGDKLIAHYVLLDPSKEERTALITAETITIMRPWQLTEAEYKPNSDLITGPEFSSVSYCYDVNPDTRQLLVADNRRFMSRCYEYDVGAKAKRKVGFAREYMFYLKRDFANSLLRRKAHLTLKDPEQFSEE